MKLSNLSQFETLNNEAVQTITGGSALDSRRNDSKSHDCKKGDTFTSAAVGQA
ncbi:ComC/BlpC family leader-containing pheromone/bacteriocin [Tenacibaculum sp. 190524A02b]|uniref:ComC/BlpC family leader-containing pheromone/bacteriocin n=1 Tax=Tenacibaculum vairaonense TaxID=3137860 RepID=UPI0031FAE99C